MAYEKTVWKARQGSGLNRFVKSQETGVSVVLENAPYEVSEPGTPFSADNMNHIEQGIHDAHGLIAGEEQARMQGDIALNARIDRVENMGDYAGSFDTYALLPPNASAFPNGITVNDFATVRADETHNGAAARYVVSAIAGGGAITWNHDFTYSTDITGKADKAASPVNGNFAGLNAQGNLTDSGKKASDFMASPSAQTANTQVLLAPNVKGNAPTLKAVSDFVQASQKGVANGVASLDANSKLPLSQLPDGLGGGGGGGSQKSPIVGATSDISVFLWHWQNAAPGDVIVWLGGYAPNMDGHNLAYGAAYQLQNSLDLAEVGNVTGGFEWLNGDTFLGKPVKTHIFYSGAGRPGNFYGGDFNYPIQGITANSVILNARIIVDAPRAGQPKRFIQGIRGYAVYYSGSAYIGFNETIYFDEGFWIIAEYV